MEKTESHDTEKDMSNNQIANNGREIAILQKRERFFFLQIFG